MNLKFSFDHPVDVPGHVLLPGTYSFEPDASIQHVVRVFDETNGGHKLVDTFLVISAERPDAGGVQVSLKDLAPEAPKGIDKIFAEGETIGYEFVYPKK
jgi:hypothetical protein